MAVAVQVALRVMEQDPQITALDVVGPKAFSGHVLFVDEPEAHLHPSAVASVVRWCQRMVRCGFMVVAASHHEEFLRASGDEMTFVKVSRDAETSCTTARTLLSAATPLLQELATEVGMHPATALSLHRAILFVEGPLDAAVLDEYAGPAFDTAGVTIIPIHGTRNLEGLIDGEFTTRLGIKTGVLTDNTITATIWERSNTKRSGEEKKLVRLLKRFDDQGLPPPDLFGVSEEDLLFALPAEGIRQHFPTSGSKFRAA
jgi:predicted ATP-dependent endonuclease of OLD family